VNTRAAWNTSIFTKDESRQSGSLRKLGPPLCHGGGGLPTGSMGGGGRLCAGGGTGPAEFGGDGVHTWDVRNSELRGGCEKMEAGGVGGARSLLRTDHLLGLAHLSGVDD
jgi:hypothetical protein